eukprot:123015_1
MERNVTHSSNIHAYNPSYRLSTDSFISTGCPESCPITLAPLPQYYTQSGHWSDRLFITDGRKLIYYDLVSRTWINYQHYSLNVKFPTRMNRDTQCLASNDKYLIGVGG